MENTDRILRNLERTKHGLPITTKLKDSYSKNLQLQWCYQAHWDEVRDIFKHYKVDLKHHSPIITIQTLKEVRLARDLTEKLKNDPEIRSMAENVSYPLRNVYPAPNITEEDLIDGTIFIVILRLIPYFCLEMAKPILESFFENGNREKYLDNLFRTHGTIIETQKNFEDAVKDMLKENFK